MRLGLTGGIGSGKSTAALMLRELGWQVVDTDAIARQLTAPGGQALTAIAAQFGSQVLGRNGELDRATMRAIVFSDSKAKAALEGILHPLIVAEALDQARFASHVVFDLPLLAESSHWRARVERVLVIDCDLETQVQRVAQRPGWSVDQARAAIASQASRPTRRAIADAVIDNTHIDRCELNARLQLVSRHWLGPVEESAA